jgi:predicted nucleic acid-binding protein
MIPVFADTSYYIALFYQGDSGHDAAFRFSREDVRPVLLTDFILVELANSLCRGGGRQLFVDLVGNLRSDPSVTIIPASRALLDAGLRLYAQRKDKDWSLTDCTSFVAMRQHRLTDALTADHHFEQAGFNVLLR